MAAGADDACKGWIVGAVSLVFLPLVIDFYGVVVALPAIGRDLHSSTTSLAWTVKLQFVLGYDPLRTGLFFLVFSVPSCWSARSRASSIS